MREAGDRTTWTDPDEAYEAAVHAAVDAAFDDERGARRPRGLLDARSSAAGCSNALAAKLLSLTVPGVPDVYQGSELGDLSLVDPDNRRPVDFDAPRLRSLAAGDRPDASGSHRARAAAAPRPAGAVHDVHPLLADGPAAEHVLAFDRGGAVTVVTRLPLGLAAGRLGRDQARPARRRGRAGWPTCSAATPPAACWSSRGSATLPRSAGGRSTCGRRRAARLRLSVGDATVAMVRGEDDWWTPAAPLPSREETDYGYLIDDADTPRPDPRSRRQPAGVHRRSRTHDPTRFAWTDDALDRPPARRVGDLRAARRHLHARGHLRRRARPASTTCAASGSTSSS